MSGSFKNRGGLDKRFAVLMTSTALKEKFLDDWYNIHPESYDKLYELEPWCSTIYVNPEHVAGYIGMEQDNTLFNLKDRVKYIGDEVTNDVVVEFDLADLTNQSWGVICS